MIRFARVASAAAVIVGSLAGGGAAQAQTPPEGLVWMVLRDINALGFDRDDPMNRAPLVTSVPDGMIQAVDVSRDGRPDWLVDYQVALLTPYCGTGGCVKRLYVSKGDGYRRAFDNQALTLTVLPGGQVETWVHNIYCVEDDEDCRYRFAWNAETGRLERTWSSGSRAEDGGAYPPIDPGAAND